MASQSNLLFILKSQHVEIVGFRSKQYLKECIHIIYVLVYYIVASGPDYKDYSISNAIEIPSLLENDNSK